MTSLITKFCNTASEDVLVWVAGGLAMGPFLGLGYLFALTHGWLG